jgi:hypothetical protein
MLKAIYHYEKQDRADCLRSLEWPSPNYARKPRAYSRGLRAQDLRALS